MPDEVQPRERAAGTAYTKTPEKLARHVEGVEWPARKEDLLRAARGNAAPPEVLRALETLPGARFEDPEELRVAYEAAQAERDR